MLEQKIYDFITKYNLIENGDRIVLGVSGGPDSICMLDILYKISQSNHLNFEIIVAHINHGLRSNAQLDEQFVENFCQKIGVQFFVKHTNIKELAEKQKRGLEETGRIVRYKFFDEITEKTNSNKIAIAHNSNDRAETIIMNILRGSGTRGLIGIEKINGKYIRPLIETERYEIEQYLKEHNIIARHDESNDENIYTRNKIRNIVMPYIKEEFNPNIITTLKRLSDIVIEEERYLKSQTVHTFNEILIDKTEREITLDLKKFNKLDIVIQKRIILYSINKVCGSTNGIEKIHIDDIIKLCNNNIGNKYLTPNKHTKIVTKMKQLKIIAVKC